MKVLVVDDERLARSEMIRMLREYPTLCVVGEAVNAEDAQEKILALAPDVVFLDIEMPGRDVFSMLVSLERAPQVVFTTAFSQYALQAFDCSATDYLLKPIDRRRLKTAVEKLQRNEARLATQEPPAPGDKEAPALPSDTPAEETDTPAILGEEDRIFLRDGEKCWFVRLGDVRLFESEGNYTRLYFGCNRPLVLRSLNYLQRRLAPDVFFRASRKIIVNIKWISRIDPIENDRLEVTLDEGFRTVVSRRQSLLFKSRLEL